MRIAVVLLTLSAVLELLIGFKLYNENQVLRATNKTLNNKIDTIQIQLDNKPNLPDWLYKSYKLCSSSQVPQNFIKECIAFEMKR